MKPPKKQVQEAFDQANALMSKRYTIFLEIFDLKAERDQVSVLGTMSGLTIAREKYGVEKDANTEKNYKQIVDSLYFMLWEASLKCRSKISFILESCPLIQVPGKTHYERKIN